MRLTADDVRAIRQTVMKVSQQELADTLGINVRTVRRWEATGASRFATVALSQWKEELDG